MIAKRSSVRSRRVATYGEVIRQARLEKGLILRDVANATGLSVGFLSRLERGERTDLMLSNAVAICEALGIPLGQLASKMMPLTRD